MKRALFLSIICLACLASSLAADRLTVSDVKVKEGSEAVIDIGCELQTMCKAYQIDVELGSGFTLKLDAAGKPVAECVTATDHEVYSRRVSDSKYRFVVVSMSGQQLPQSGSLLRMTVIASSSAKAGSSITGSVRAIEFTTAQTTALHLSDVTFTVSVVSQSLLGDVNDDGSVSVTDVGYTINYILEQIPTVFIFDAADMNHDGSISVTDVGYIIDLILSDTNDSRTGLMHGDATLGSIALYKEAATLGSVLANASVPLAAHYITLEKGGLDYRFSIANAENYIGFQMDVTLPDGIGLTAARLDAENTADHTLVFRQVTENKYRIVCYSMENSPLNQGANALLTLSTTAATDGLRISDILFTTIGLGEAPFFIGDATGIAGIGMDGESAPLFDMQGRRMDATKSLRKGVYISEGKKSIRK